MNRLTRAALIAFTLTAAPLGMIAQAEPVAASGAQAHAAPAKAKREGPARRKLADAKPASQRSKRVATPISGAKTSATTMKAK